MSIMSSEDIFLIVNLGAPAEPRPEFVIVEADGSIQLTARGRQFYRLASVWYGLKPEPVEHVRDIEDLSALGLRIQQIKLLYDRDIEDRERRGGRLPVKARAIVHALRYAPEELNAAVEQRLLCESFGENVIPGPFRKRTLN